ncbi:ABC transporter permease, partial [Candidatus Bipolaricaulota bacterium]|nr:ABC transporter permease [Candidatus Bipolaricaulota bacterium]
MRLTDLLRFSSQGFVHRKGRTVLTLLGVTVGTMALLLIIGLGEGLHSQVVHELTRGDALRQVLVRASAPRGEGTPRGDVDVEGEMPEAQRERLRRAMLRRRSGPRAASDVRLQPLHIRPEGIFDKVTEFFGVDDIDFESAEFSRAFHVKAAEKRWAYDVLHVRTMEFLLGMPRLSIQFDEHDVLVWRNRRFKPEQFEEAIAVAEGILDRLPPYLIEQQANQQTNPRTT